MTGRWPANVILSPGAARVLDEQSGILKSGALDTSRIRAANQIFGARPKSLSEKYEADEGGASRFFLQAGYEPWELEWILANGLVPYTGTV